MVHDATIPLTVRQYGSKAGDWQTVAEWWDRTSGMFAETILPPLGVIVECQNEPIAALWCYETYGIGVAFLEFPCTRPGIPPGLAWRALSWAEHAITSVLRSRGEHKLVRAFAQSRHMRAMKRMGYEVTGLNFTSFMRRLD